MTSNDDLKKATYCNSHAIVELITQDGFEVVAEKFDGVMSSMFLCKKKQSVLEDQDNQKERNKEKSGIRRLIDVSDVDDYGWVEEVCS